MANGNEEKVGGGGWLFWFIFWTLGWFLFSVILALAHHFGWICLVASLGAIVSRLIFRVYIIPLFLAPRHICWTTVKEGTAVVILKGGKFHKQYANYDGFFLDTDGCVKRMVPGAITIIPKREKNRVVDWLFSRVIGGTIWYGLTPIYRRLRYHQVWKVFRENETEKVKKYDKNIDYVFLLRDFYIFEYSRKPDEAIEDINKVPIVGVSIIVPIRVYNPKVAVYSTKNWLESIGAILWPKFENFVSFFRWDVDLLGMKVGKDIEDLHQSANRVFHKQVHEGDDLKELLWNDLKESVNTDDTFIDNIPGEREKCFSVFGVIIYYNGFRVYKIDPDKKYRDAAAAQRLEEQQGEAKVKKAEKDGEAKVKTAEKTAIALAKEGKGVQDNLLARTVEFAIQSLSKKYGLPEDDIRQKLLTDEGLKKEYDEVLTEGRRREAMDSEQYNEQVYPKDASMENMISMLIKK